MDHVHFADVVAALAQCKQASAADEVFEIGTGIAFCPFGNFVEIDVLTNWHAGGVNT